MYPASPAALLSYLVLRLIECDTLRRQKSQLIQGNKLPTQSKGSHTSSPHPATRSPVNLRLSGFFFNSPRRWADLKSSGPEYSAFSSSFIDDCNHVFLNVDVKGTKLFFCVFYYRGICNCRCFYSSIQTFTFRLDGFWMCNTCVSNPPVLLYAYCCNLKAQNIQHICHGHFWTPQLKNYAGLQRLVVHWGKPVDYKAVQPGALCSQGIPALFIVCFRSPERGCTLHVSACAFEHWFPISLWTAEGVRQVKGIKWVNKGNISL